MKIWGSLDWIFICLSTKFQLKIPSFAPRKALMSTQKKYVYSCQMGFGSECSLGGTQLPAPPGQLGGTPVLGQSGHRACTLPPTDVPPPQNCPSPSEIRPVTMPAAAACGRPGPGRHARLVRAGQPRVTRPSVLCCLSVVRPCSAWAGVVPAACGRPGTARHGFVLNLATRCQVKGDVLGVLAMGKTHSPRPRVARHGQQARPFRKLHLLDDQSCLAKQAWRHSMPPYSRMP